MTAERPLRVAFLGNVANTHHRAARALRDRGIDAHVFVSDTDAPASRPENDDPTLAGAYPDWIHGGPWITPASLLAPWRSRVASELRVFDVVVASGPGPIFAQFAGRPWAFWVTGGDLTVKPFPVAFRSWYPNWRHRAAEVVAGGWQRRAARRADQVWMQPFGPMADAAERLRIPPASRRGRALPIVVDTAAYAPGAPVSAAARAYALDAVDDADFVVFHPSRLVTEASEPLVRTGQWKGNDTLVRGFAQLVRDHPDRKPVLLLPDTPLSRDVAPVKALVADLGIEANVRWLVPPDGRLFDLDHMAALYDAAHVVADEFGVGWFGYVSLEGLATGRPVLGRVDESVMAQLYDGHPIRSARSEREVAAALTALLEDPEGAAAQGRAGRAWVVAHHGPEAAATAYAEAVRSLAP